ncbi:hypothetical protein DWX41_07885 [Hungatella hathewayi]|uniref:Uncharacterized protein n=1 Tax=Hungatella hathewayi TaxID=154046 RepID=A0A3E2WZF3_9FIRM|nr:hypothetical protein DWX41_07885 [Hungatella hathewayi]GKH33326.1 hypothetical protein CE91St64_27330 [Faecalicatena contorta]
MDAQWEQDLVEWGEGAEKTGSLSHAESIYAILLIRSVNVRDPKGKNIENGGPAACNPKYDNFGLHAASEFAVRLQILPTIFYVFSLRVPNVNSRINKMAYMLPA